MTDSIVSEHYAGDEDPCFAARPKNTLSATTQPITVAKPTSRPSEFPTEPNLEAWLHRSRTTDANDDVLYRLVKQDRRDVGDSVLAAFSPEMLFNFSRRGVRPICQL